MACRVFKQVCNELLSFADSNRSLIKDAIDLFRIFQRVSASRTFYARFSSDCYKLFEWATDFIAMISDAIVPKEHFSMYELFQLYCLASNIFMANFILILFTSNKFITFIPFFGLAILFGAGYSYAEYNAKYVVILVAVACGITIFSVAGIIIPYIPCFTYLFCSFYRGIQRITEDGATVINRRGFLKLTMMMVAGAIVFSTATSPIMFRHRVIGIYFCIVMSAIIVCAFIYEIFIYLFKKPLKISNLIQLVNKIIDLCLVPGTETFIQLVLTSFGVQWNVVVSFVVLTVIFPIVITVVLIISGYEDLTDTYKSDKCCDYRYIEIVNHFHRIVYAMLAALDIPYGCIGVEGAWLLLIIIIRPYNSYSDTILNMGESIIMILGNTAAVAGSGFFSFEVSILFVALATTPVIFSVIAYFAFDFEVPRLEDEKSMDDLDGNKEIIPPESDSMEMLALTAIFLAPISWFLFGTNIRLMFGTVIIN